MFGRLNRGSIYSRVQSMQSLSLSGSIYRSPGISLAISGIVRNPQRRNRISSVTLATPTSAEGIAVFPWFRLIRVAFSLIGAPKVDLLATTRVRLRVWPNDLDINLHVNNGRYLALADIGRVHWFVRTRALAVARQQNAFPVVGDAIAKFRRDLKVFQSFEIHTRLLGWDHKWGFVEHRFMRDNRVIGVVAIRGVFKAPGGALNPETLLKGLAHAAPSPELPEWTNCFQQSSELLSETLRAEESPQHSRERNT
jgi:acyl-CoA thioesterase FadM